MIAKFKTKCVACNPSHMIYPGENIIRYKDGWTKSDCVNNNFDTIKRNREIEYEMYLKGFKIDQFESTDEYYKKALELGICKEEDLK